MEIFSQISNARFFVFRKFDTLCASDYIIINFTLSLPADSTNISWIQSLLKYKQVRCLSIPSIAIDLVEIEIIKSIK